MTARRTEAHTWVRGPGYWWCEDCDAKADQCPPGPVLYRDDGGE